MLAAKAKLKLLNKKKSKGPDGITPKLLKTCADQHGEAYISIFNWFARNGDTTPSFNISVLAVKATSKLLNEEKKLKDLMALQTNY